MLIQKIVEEVQDIPQEKLAQLYNTALPGVMRYISSGQDLY